MDLGNLWFSLGLDKSKFENDLKDVEKKINNTITKGMQVGIGFKVDDTQLKNVINKLKNDPSLQPTLTIKNIDLKGAEKSLNAIKTIMADVAKRGLDIPKTFDTTRLNAFISKMQDLYKVTAKVNQEMKNMRNHIRDITQSGLSQFLKSYEASLRGISKVYRDIEKMQKQIAKTARVIGNAQGTALRNINNISRAYSSQKSIITDINSLVARYASLLGIFYVGKQIASVTAEFELQRVALRSIVKDIASAETIFERFKIMAVQSPFQFKDLVGFAKQLSAFSIPTDELVKTTKMLADVSAGLGVNMDRLILAYGQIRSASFLRGQEVRQLTEAGVPILELLARQFTEIEGRMVSAGQIFEKISRREVPFAMVKKAFEDMTNQGGMFYRMQEVQAKTLKGLFSNLKDRLDILFNTIGEGNNGVLYGFVQWLTKIIDNTDNAALAFKRLVTAMLVGKGINLAIAGFNNLSSAISVFNRSMKVATTTGAKFKVFLRSFGSNIGNWVGIIMAAIGVISALRKEVTELEKLSSNLGKILGENLRWTSTELANYDALIAHLKSLNKESDEYNLKKVELLNKYDPYIQKLKEEGKWVDNLAGNYENLRIKIEQMYKQKRASQMIQQAEENYFQSANKAAQSILNGELILEDSFSTVFDKLGVRGDVLQGVIEPMLPLGDFELIKNVITNYLGKDIDKVIKYNTARGREGSFEFDISGYDAIEQAMNHLQSQYERRIKPLKDAFDNTLNAFEKAGFIPAGEGDNATPLFDWVKNVNDLVVKMLPPQLHNVQIDNSAIFTEFISNARKQYEGVVKELKNAYSSTTKTYKELAEDQALAESKKAFYEALFAMFGLPIEEQKDTNASQQLNNALKALKVDLDKIVRTYKTYLNIVDKFPDMDKNKASDYAKSIYGTEYYTGPMTNEGVTEYIRQKARRIGGKTGEDYMESLITQIQDTSKNRSVDVLDAMKKLLEKSEQWSADTLEYANGSDSVKVRQNAIISKFKKNIEKIKKDGKDVQEMLDEMKREADANPALKSLLESINPNWEREFAESYENYKDAYIKYFINQANSELVSLAEARKNEIIRAIPASVGLDDRNAIIEEAMDNVESGNDNWLDSVALEKLGLSAEEANAKLVELLQTAIKLSQAGEGANLWISALEGLAGFNGISGIASFAKDIVSNGNSISKLNKEYKDAQKTGDAKAIKGAKLNLASGWIGMAAKLGQSLYKGISQAVKAVKDFNKESEKLNHNLALTENNALINQGKNKGFISDFTSQIEGGAKALKSASASAKNALSDLKGVKVRTGVNKFTTAIKGIFGGSTSYKQGSLLKEYPQLINAEGKLNIEMAKTLVQSNKLKDSAKERVQKAIDWAEQEKKAYENLVSIITSLTDNMGENIKNALVNAFKSGEDAFSNMKSAVEKGIGALLEDLAFSAVFSKIFEQFEQSMLVAMESDNKEQAILDLVPQLITDIQNGTDAFNFFMDNLKKEGEKRGLDLFANASDNTATNTIKNITEETGNRLVSMNNAIRNDVSVMRSVMISTLPNLSNINSNISQALVLWQRIDINTKRSADDTERLYKLVDSMSGAYNGGSGRALKVNIA